MKKNDQSPTDMFSIDHKSDFQRNSRKSFSNEHDTKNTAAIATMILFQINNQNHNDFRKSRHSPTDSEKSQSRKNSNRSKDGTDQSDNDDDHLLHQTKRPSVTKQRHSTHDFAQVIKILQKKKFNF